VKALIITAMLTITSGCATFSAETIIPAKGGVVLCPQTGALSFIGNVVLNGSWIVFTPADKQSFRTVAAPDCVVLVTDEVGAN